MMGKTKTYVVAVMAFTMLMLGIALVATSPAAAHNTAAPLAQATSTAVITGTVAVGSPTAMMTGTVVMGSPTAMMTGTVAVGTPTVMMTSTVAVGTPTAMAGSPTAMMAESPTAAVGGAVASPTAMTGGTGVGLPQTGGTGSLPQTGNGSSDFLLPVGLFGLLLLVAGFVLARRVETNVR